MTNKLVIRRLPPSIGEEEFLRQVSPLPEHDYFCFFEADPSLGSHAFSRAYINFISPQDTSTFKDQFDNYVFLDRNGHEYPAVVEHSLWHKSPRNGPFFKPADSFQSSPCAKPSDADLTVQASDNVQVEPLTGLEQDADFLEFVQRIKSPKRRSQQSPIEALESNLDAITNPSNSSASNNVPSKSGSKAAKIVSPPSVNQRRPGKNGKKQVGGGGGAK